MLPQEDLDRLSKTVEDVFPMSRQFVCLSKSKQSLEKSRQSEVSMSLSRFSDSHTTPSPVHCIGHSIRCHQLIELAQFADMCRDRDEDDDTYSLEMMTYFNDDDVITVSTKPHLNSLTEKSHQENDNDTREKIVVKRKGKKTIRVFSDEEDDFVQCLRSRRMSCSSEDDDPLPRPFQSPSISHKTTKSTAKSKLNAIENEPSFDSLLPQLSQFDVVATKASPASLKGKPVISEAPSIDDTFGGLLSQLPRPELAYRDNRLVECEAMGKENFLQGLPVVKNKEDRTIMAAAVCDLNSEINYGLSNNQEKQNVVSPSRKDETVRSPAECKTVCDISDYQTTTDQMREQPVAGNVRRCAARKLQPFQFERKEDKTHRKTEGNSTFPLPTEPTVIPDSASEENSDEDQERIEPIRRLKHHNPNVFRSPDTPMTKVGKQQKRTVRRTVNREESDDDFESETGMKRQNVRNSNKKTVNTKPVSIMTHTRSGLNDQVQNRKGQEGGRQYQVKDGCKQSHKVDLVRDFFDEEAVLSDDAGIVSSDENVGSEVDSYVADSFIDDNTQPSEHRSRVRCHSSESPSDMLAVYRKSLMSPSCQRGTYKLVFGHQCNGRRLQYSISELDSSFIDDNEVGAMDGSQAEEDNRFVMTEEEEEDETEIDSIAGKQATETDSESPSFVLPGAKGRRRQRQVLDASSEQENVMAVEPKKKSPRLSTVATSSPQILVSPSSKFRPSGSLLPKTGNQLTPISKTRGELPVVHSHSECQKSAGCSMDTSQFDMVTYSFMSVLSCLTVSV